MRKITSLCGLICLIGISINCFATTYYVNPGESIQDAIDSSIHGDTVVVSQGTYYENIFFNGKNIVLTNTDPDSAVVIASTIIDGSMPDNPDSGSVVTFDGSEIATCILAGFTIQNGSGTGANYWDHYGGGIYGNGCYATIQNNVISGNSADGGGGIGKCDGIIQNNAIIWNSASFEGGGLLLCNGQILNNTISGNFAFMGGGLDGCNGTITNCIIWGNTTRYGTQIGWGSIPTYSCIQDWTDGGEGNISSDPLLAYDGYHLKINSPCIDQGADTNAPLDDIDGEPRPHGLWVDMGADEYLDSDSDGLPNWIEAMGVADINGDYDSDNMPNGWEYDNGLNPTVDDADSDADDDGFSNYQEYLDGTNPLDPFSKAVLFTIYVSPTGGDTYPYQSWDDASTSIQAAIDASYSGDTVIVAQGIYYENIRFDGKSIVLTSTDPSSKAVIEGTIIDGSDSGSVVTFSGPEVSRCVLTGFTIRNGIAPDGGGIDGNYCRATIQNNIITGNSADWNGGGLSGCDGLVQNNIISGNSAEGGGGLSSCNGTIRNNIITGNSGVGGYAGGLAYCRGTIVNCIIWGNIAMNMPQVDDESSKPTYSCIQGWADGGEGNITDNPLLAYDKYHLKNNSPCIDLGTDTNAPLNDIDGEPRPQSLGIDIGADEYLDSDSDGLPDWIEAMGVIDGGDFDFDNMPNSWEYNNGLDPTIDDADSDIDNDGFSNYQEYLDDTNPLDPFSKAAFFTFFVSPTGGDSYPYNSWGNAATTIQAAIDASLNGDRVIVAQGIYYENIKFNGKNIVLTSIDPDSLMIVSNTIIDGSDSGSVVTFNGTETSQCVLTGFTIRNGNGSYRIGGGIHGNYCNVTIQSNIITGNSVNYTSAALYGCNGTVSESIISLNGGGGLELCGGTILHNVISGNLGSGLYDCGGIIQNNIISGNTDSGLNECAGTIQNNIITGNSGGGLSYCFGTIQNNTISGNEADWYGGGLYDCDGAILDNTITGNSASYGGGLYDCNGTITNCIIWGNTAPTWPQLYASSTPEYSCIQDWTGGGAGNISSGPLFVGYAHASATWTFGAVYDTGTFQSRLTDGGAAWAIDSLTGMFVRPDTTSVFQYPIVSNTDTTITVWCDLSDSVQLGDSYEIYDYHLQAGSPCIDAGDSTIFVGYEDLGGDFRYVSSAGDPGWSGRIDNIRENDDQSIMLIWKQHIDMGAYEYQVPYTYETFTVQSRDALDTGTWQDRFTGNVGTWTDTDTSEAHQRFYRVYGE
jgi:hypothetical protein